MVAGKKAQYREHARRSAQRRKSILDARQGKEAKGSTSKSVGGKPSKPMKPR